MNKRIKKKHRSIFIMNEVYSFVKDCHENYYDKVVIVPAYKWNAELGEVIVTKKMVNRVVKQLRREGHFVKAFFFKPMNIVVNYDAWVFDFFQDEVKIKYLTKTR